MTVFPRLRVGHSTAEPLRVHMRPHVANPRPLDCFLRFIVLCFLQKQIINDVAFRLRRDVYTARLMDLRNRYIVMRERWCHRSMAE